MNFEKIEQAYDLLLENCQTIQNQLKTHIYEAIIEQNAYYLSGEGSDELIKTNNKVLKDLALSQEEWRRTFQFLFIKAAQTEPLQPNHHFTPDIIGFIMLFLVEELTNQDTLDVLDIGSGTGNLGQTLLINSSKTLDYMGIELDDLLIDLAASIADVMGDDAHFVQEDAVRPQRLKESDVIVSDLPIGFYPNDEIASRYEVYATGEHTYAHHLLMEQALKYLKPHGTAILLAPSNLLISEQSHLLKKWLKAHASVVAVIALPETLFANQQHAKSLFVLKKALSEPIETFVYHLQDLKNPEVIRQFMEKFKNWKRKSNI